jgi:S-methyl-5-thioribose-1-phosphate isomerase
MKAVEFTGEAVRLLDQSMLPHEERWLELRSVEEIADAIRQMKVRGAPAIGVAAAYAMVFSKDPEKDAEFLKSSRPTAVDLTHAIDFMLDMHRNGIHAVQAATKWDGMNDERCAKVSGHGASLIGEGQKVLTHCNTGFMAANSHGTALGAIKLAYAQGKGTSVLVDETRPRLQGALTSWELLKAGVPHKAICDSAAGSLMKQKQVDLVMVGADRIAANGDTANKIGTYPLSVLAKEHGIPFYVLAPLPSFDESINSGDDIEVEERDVKEVLEIQGKRIYPEGAEALNPAFDITPAGNITAWVNEDGVFRSMDELWKSTKDPSSFSQELTGRYLR